MLPSTAPKTVTSSPPSAAPAGRARRRARNDVSAYDFRRPIQLSREHARMLQLTLDGFAKQATTAFTSSLRTVCSMSLLSIDQQSYAEYVDTLDSPTYMTIIGSEALHSPGVLNFPMVATMTCVDHMLGGPGTGNQPVRALTEIESGVVTGLVERLLADLDYSLKGVLDLRATVRGVEYSPQFAQVAGASDIMVVALFDLRIGTSSHQVSLCLPFPALLPHLVKAAAPAPVSEHERNQRERAAGELRHQFQKVPVDVAVRLRPTAVSPATLAALQPGQVLRLAHPSAAPLEVVVDGTTFAHATPGARGPRLAALIVGTPKENS